MSKRVRTRPYSERQLKVVDASAQSLGFKDRHGIMRQLGEWGLTFGDIIREWFDSGKDSP